MLNRRVRNKIKKKYKRSFLIKISTFFDPFKKFEETKYENFKNSSRLEGLDIIYPNEETTIEEILTKYTKVS